MQSKFRKRISHIGFNTLSNLSSQVFNILISILVIRFCSKELWGEVVGVMLWIGVATHINSFGNKELVLKIFSLKPSVGVAEWQRGLSTRFLFLLISILCFLSFHYSTSLYIYVSLLLIIRFFYQSYEPIIAFHRLFKYTLILETSTFISTAFVMIVCADKLTLTNIFFVYTVFEFTKVVFVAYILRKTYPLTLNIHPSIRHIIVSFPFFILTFSGMLSSKIDLICVTHYLPKSEIAQYQVFINLMLLLQATPNFILLPFVKNIYRLKNKSIQKLSNKLFIIGIPIAIAGVLGVKFLLNIIYNFDIDLRIMLIAVVFVLPVFYYLPLVYLLYKANLQRMLVLINIVSVIVGLIFSVILTPEHGIAGALAATAMSQWAMLVIIIFVKKRLLKIIKSK